MTTEGNKTRTTTEVPVDIEEIALSLRGWEIVEARARVVSETYGDGEHFHKLHISGAARFNESDWVDSFSFSRDYPAPVVAIVRSAVFSEFDTSFTLFYSTAKEAAKTIRFSDADYFVDTYSEIDHDHIAISITSFDGFEGASSANYLPYRAVKLPCEIHDETAQSAIVLQINVAEIITHGSDSDQDSHGNIRMSGTVAVGDLSSVWSEYRQHNDWIDDDDTPQSHAPFTISAPSLTVDFLDSSGFLVYQESLHLGIEVPVSTDCTLPSRTAQWLVDESFDPSEFSAPPERAIVHIQVNN